MPIMGNDDAFEAEYMHRLRALLSGHGVLVDYERDRAALDTGLHLFVRRRNARHATHVRVWFQAVHPGWRSKLPPGRHR